MKLENFSETVDLHGFLIADPVYVEAGTSTRTGKAYDAFANMTFLPLNQRKTREIAIDLRFLDEITAATTDMAQCQRIVITGNRDAEGHFRATEVRPYAPQ